MVSDKSVIIYFDAQSSDADLPKIIKLAKKHNAVIKKITVDRKPLKMYVVTFESDEEPDFENLFGRARLISYTQIKFKDQNKLIQGIFKNMESLLNLRDVLKSKKETPNFRLKD